MKIPFSSTSFIRSHWPAGIFTVFLVTGMSALAYTHTNTTVNNAYGSGDPSTEVASELPNSDDSTSAVDAHQLKVAYIEPQYAADFSDDEVLMGASHNVFVGTVLSQIGTKERGIGPETQFSVQVLQNIKGDLSGTVTVDQQGGIKDGTLYVIADEDAPSDPDTYLLKPGATYLFATRYNKSENWYTLNPYPTASKLIASFARGPTSQISSEAIANDPRVRQLQAAYSKEIPLKADLINNNALNSYASTAIKLREDIQEPLNSSSTSTSTPDITTVVTGTSTEATTTNPESETSVEDHGKPIDEEVQVN